MTLEIRQIFCTRASWEALLLCNETGVCYAPHFCPTLMPCNFIAIKADAHVSLFFTWRNLVCTFCTTRQSFRYVSFFRKDKKCSEKCSTPSEHFYMTKMFRCSQSFFFSPCILNFNLCVPASSPPWQINSFVNVNSSPHPSAASTLYNVW